MRAMFDQNTAKPILKDPFGRTITYLRLSVTDRCDLRCTYCMAEDMTFLPKREVLSLEELLAVCTAFIHRGVRKIRLTGGEPLVRRDILWLINALGAQLGRGMLDELTLTTNGTQLPRFAGDLARAGMRRVNVSLDSRDPDRFRAITRLGDVRQVEAGIDAAQDAGLRVKVNMVAVRGVNDDEIADMLAWCSGRGMDLTLIETMPMGDDIAARDAQFLPLTAVLDDLKAKFQLTPSQHQTGGPARYYDVGTSGTRLGLITPLTQNFCAGCNRVRVTCTGRIYMCLGQDDHIDLRAALRGETPHSLDTLLDRAMLAKPERHDFAAEGGQLTGGVGRHMSHTGG